MFRSDPERLQDIALQKTENGGKCAATERRRLISMENCRYNPRLSSKNPGVSLMARVCQVTGKAPMVGNNVSHANNKTKRRFLPNLHYRRFWVESENRFIRLRVSNAGLRLIDKKGIDAILVDLRARGEV